jgi:hypothetical protein
MCSIFMERRMRLWAPLCRQHRHHWTKRVVFNVVFGVLLFMALVGMVTLPDAWGMSEAEKHTFKTWSGTGLLVLAAAWLLANMVISRFMICATRITVDDMELRGVHEGFVAALADQQGAQGPYTGIPEILPVYGDDGHFFDPKTRKRPDAAE